MTLAGAVRQICDVDHFNWVQQFVAFPPGIKYTASPPLAPITSVACKSYLYDPIPSTNSNYIITSASVPGQSSPVANFGNDQYPYYWPEKTFSYDVNINGLIAKGTISLTDFYYSTDYQNDFESVEHRHSGKRVGVLRRTTDAE